MLNYLVSVGSQLSIHSKGETKDKNQALKLLIVIDSTSQSVLFPVYHIWL